jgi:2-C-methyl-D-erythritol 4-phosphate cytidylyltransferase
MSVWAIVVAAGSGSRFGERKQYRTINGIRLLDWALRVPVERCDGVVLVVPRDQVDQPEPSVDAVFAGADAAIPTVPISDTLWSAGGGTLPSGPVDRTGVVAVQTPQAFRRTALWTAHAGGGEATDDATLVQATGGRVVTVDGDPSNLKVTTPIDLSVAELLCQ